MNLQPERGESVAATNKSMKGRGEVWGLFYEELGQQAKEGEAEGAARLKLFKQSVFFQRPFPVLCFFSPPNTTALLFSSAERGKIRCHHLNING